MTVIADTYEEFLVECRNGFEDLCWRIDAGEVPAGTSVKLTIDVPPSIVDRLLEASNGD